MNPEPGTAAAVPASTDGPPLLRRQATPSLAWSALRILDLSLGQMLWSRRSVFLGVLLGGPVLLAAAVRLTVELYARGFRINGATAAGADVFGLMMWLL